MRPIQECVADFFFLRGWLGQAAINDMKNNFLSSPQAKDGTAFWNAELDRQVERRTEHLKATANRLAITRDQWHAQHDLVQSDALEWKRRYELSQQELTRTQTALATLCNVSETYLKGMQNCAKQRDEAQLKLNEIEAGKRKRTLLFGVAGSDFGADPGGRLHLHRFVVNGAEILNGTPLAVLPGSRLVLEFVPGTVRQWRLAFEEVEGVMDSCGAAIAKSAASPTILEAAAMIFPEANTDTAAKRAESNEWGEMLKHYITGDGKDIYFRQDTKTWVCGQRKGQRRGNWPADHGKYHLYRRGSVKKDRRGDKK